MQALHPYEDENHQMARYNRRICDHCTAHCFCDEFNHFTYTALILLCPVKLTGHSVFLIQRIPFTFVMQTQFQHSIFEFAFGVFYRMLELMHLKPYF